MRGLKRLLRKAERYLWNLPAAIALSTLLGMAIWGADYYSTDREYARRTEGIKIMRLQPDSSSAVKAGPEKHKIYRPDGRYSYFGKRLAIQRLQNAEARFERDLPLFLDCFSQEDLRMSVTALRNEREEKGGYVAYASKCYGILFKKDETDEIVKRHIADLRNGKAGRAGSLVSIMNGLYGEDTPVRQKALETALRVYALSAGCESMERCKLGYIDPEAGTAEQFPPELIKSNHDNVSRLLNRLEEDIRLSYGHTNREVLEEEKFFAYFHTHPDGTPPSGPDISNSSWHGPSLLFSFTREGIDLYAIVDHQFRMVGSYKGE